MTSANGATGTGSKHKRKVVGVVLLGGEELIVHVDIKAKFYEVFNQVSAHLNLRETEYFGLALCKDEEYQFLVLDEKISKIAPKKWKTSAGEGWDSDGSTPLFTVWFRVQFYVDQVVLLREKVTRHLYYLQLKENVLKYDHLYNEEKCFQIVAFALQADFGNFIADRHIAGYFDPCLYFPAWMVEKRGMEYLTNNCPMVHGDLHNMTRTDAELKYVRECSTQPGAHNLHFYRARKKKTDKVCNTWLAVCYRGVEVYEDDAGYKNLISTFLWQDIGRIVFDKKRFEIRSAERAGGRRFTYYTENDGTSKYLLNFCRSTHQFQMAIQPKLMEIRHLDAEDKKRYKESYIYSDARDLHANGGPVRHRSGRSPGSCAVGTQRYSVVSDVSSNTTSGIGGDKMALSFDEEEETGREIIIDCPPKPRSLQGTPAHPHPRVPLRGSYKMTSPTPSSRSPALPPQSLDLFPSPRSSSGKGSPASPHLQELSPASSNGSYRAKFQQSTTHASYIKMGKVYALPLTPFPSSPGRAFSLTSTSPPSPGKVFSLTNNSPSSGKAFSLTSTSPSSPGKAFSLSNPSPSSPHDWESPDMGKCVGYSDSFKGLQGVMLPERRNVSGDSTATSGSTASTGTVALSVEGSPVTPATSRGPVGQHCSPSASRTPSFSYSPASVSQVLPTTVLGSSFVYPMEQSSSLQAGSFMFPHVTSLLEVPGSSPPLHHHLATPMMLPPGPGGGHIYTDAGSGVVREEMQEVLPPLPVFVDGAKGEEMMMVGNGMSAGVVHRHPSHSSSVASSSSVAHSQGGGSSVDSSQTPLDGSNSAHHSAQSSEEDPGMKDSNGDLCMPRKSGGGKRNTPAKVKAGSRSKATHVSVKNQKEALHPDIEQILGQSQAHSLPFIMALCNDLMTGSTHSSTGSYDTATRRSSDSHPDPRRWSTCGSVETAVATESGSAIDKCMALGGAGARPKSWHSEHFDLDSTLSMVPLSRAGPDLPAPLHQLQPMMDNHRSFPQELYAASNAGHSALWNQAMASSGGSGPCVGSMDRYSPELIAQHLMIPPRLSSGGHSVSEGGSMGPHKTLKENIGVA